MKQQAKLARRLAGTHWDALPWDGSVGRDAFLRDLDPEQVVQSADWITDELADLAVLVLFSVFEAAVRETVLAEVQPEIERLRHRTLRQAADQACAAVREGSFFRVIEPYNTKSR